MNMVETTRENFRMYGLTISDLSRNQLEDTLLMFVNLYEGVYVWPALEAKDDLPSRYEFTYRAHDEQGQG
jgi:hypothetical protein